MANHGWAIFGRNLNSQRVDELLRKINRERFDDFFIIDREDSGWEFHPELPTVCSPFAIWIESPRRLEWRHTMSLETSWWAQQFFAESVVAGLSRRALVRDEGIDEKMLPKYHLKYPKLSDWLKALDFSPDKSMWHKFFDCLPERVRTVFG